MFTSEMFSECVILRVVEKNSNELLSISQVRVLIAEEALQDTEIFFKSVYACESVSNALNFLLSV
jgi:hypothetical protein